MEEGRDNLDGFPLRHLDRMYNLVHVLAFFGDHSIATFREV